VREIRTLRSMSGDGKRGVCQAAPSYRAHPRLYKGRCCWNADGTTALPPGPERPITHHQRSERAAASASEERPGGRAGVPTLSTPAWAGDSELRRDSTADQLLDRQTTLRRVKPPPTGGVPQDSMFVAAHYPAQDHPVERRAEQPHDGDGERDRRPLPDAVPDDEHVAGERAEHHQVALGEVHELGGLVDRHEAEGDQAIDAAGRQPAETTTRTISAFCGSRSRRHRSWVPISPHPTRRPRPQRRR
jgi:hypothetical protein